MPSNKFNRKKFLNVYAYQDQPGQFDDKNDYCDPIYR